MDIHIFNTLIPAILIRVNYMNDSIIKIEDINFYYDYRLQTEQHALKDINLEIKRGEYAVFFGPSGCGKTTLTYLIGGIETEQNGSGQIYVNGNDVRKLSKDDLAQFRKTGIGIIFQQFNLIPSLTVLDNVALPMTFTGISQSKRRIEAMKILSRLGMEKYAYRYPSELSGGQQQRVGISRALANNPPIIIADEPLGNLDSENAELVLAFLKELNEKDGRTIIMVTHEAWSVRDAKKIIYLKDGAVIKQGESTSMPETKDAIPKDLFRDVKAEVSPNDVLASSLSSLLLRGFSSDETKRFEYYLSQRLSDKIDAQTFENLLDKPFHEEGVGLWKQRAIKIAALSEDFIAKKREMDALYYELEKNPTASLGEETESIRLWVLKDYTGKINSEQIKRLNDAIDKRLRGEIKQDDFRKIINSPLPKGGVGFSIHTTRHVSDRLETLLSLSQHQGIEKALTSNQSVTVENNN